MDERLSADVIVRVGIVEAVMTAPLDQAVELAIRRAPQAPGDELIRLETALLARVQAEIAVETARARGEDELAALVPTVPFPQDVVEIEQCPERVRIEGHAQHSRCLLLADGTPHVHQNGNLRWRRGGDGVIESWWETQSYELMGLGDLIRTQGVVLQLPHLPVDDARGAAPQDDAPRAIEP